MTTLTLTRESIEALPNFRAKSKKEFSAACPFCGTGDDRFLFWPDRGNYYCRRCQTKGFIDQEAESDPARLAELRAEREQSEAETAAQLAEKVKSLPSRAQFYHDSLNDQAIEWWLDKGLTLESIDRYKLGFSRRSATAYGWRKETDSYTIPYTQNGEVVSIRHRLARDIKGKYRPEFAGLGNRLFNTDRLSRTDGLLPAGVAVLVEGEIKAMVLDQAGFRVAGLPGKANGKLFDDIQEAFRPFSRVYIALDPDATDQARAVAVALGHKAVVVELPDKPDDLLTSGQLEPVELYEKMRDAALPAGAIEAKRAALEAAAIRAAAEAEALRPVYRPDVIPFLVGPAEYQRVVIPARQATYNAKEWRQAVIDDWPELDPDEEYRRKLIEKRKERAADCGSYWMTRKLLNGTSQRVFIPCSSPECPKCLDMMVSNLERALSQLDGPLTLFCTSDVESRKRLQRRLSYSESAWRTFVELDESDLSVSFATLASGYHPDGVEFTGATKEQLIKWVKGAPGFNSTAGRGELALMPSIRELYKFIVKDKFAVSADHPDAVAVSVPSILAYGPGVEIPEIAHPRDVHSLEEYQEALNYKARYEAEAAKKKGIVVFGVIEKVVYTPNRTIGELLAEFNAHNRHLRGEGPPLPEEKALETAQNPGENEPDSYEIDAYDEALQRILNGYV